MRPVPKYSAEKVIMARRKRSRAKHCPRTVQYSVPSGLLKNCSATLGMGSFHLNTGTRWGLFGFQL
ncbi:hypothetical protein D910_11442, partial [Dendroctonus ponderosae]